MNGRQIPTSVILAELLRLQRWAGGESVSTSRIFGLVNGVESVVRRENESSGISEEMQQRIEDILEDVDRDKQPADGMSIKRRMEDDGVDETDAATIMELCRLESRFGPAIDKLVSAPGATFNHLHQTRLPEQDWYGATHFMFLVDCSDGVHKKMHGVFAPALPRVGEIVSPQNGSTMMVVGIEHAVIDQGRQQGLSEHFLVPHILLEAVEDEDSEEGSL